LQDLLIKLCRTSFQSVIFWPIGIDNGFAQEVGCKVNFQQEIDRALKEHSAGRLIEAEAIYRKILAENPNHPPALHLLGVALSQQGNKRAAAEYISRAIAVNPNVPDFHSNLALAYCESGEPEKVTKGRLTRSRTSRWPSETWPTAIAGWAAMRKRMSVMRKFSRCNLRIPRLCAPAPRDV